MCLRSRFDTRFKKCGCSSSSYSRDLAAAGYLRRAFWASSLRQWFEVKPPRRHCSHDLYFQARWSTPPWSPTSTPVIWRSRSLGLCCQACRFIHRVGESALRQQRYYIEHAVSWYYDVYSFFSFLHWFFFSPSSSGLLDELMLWDSELSANGSEISLGA